MPHQQEVYDFLKDKKTGAMFLDPGLGKTFVAIKLMQNLGYKKIIIFGPSAVQKNWENEIERFWPACNLPIHVSYGGDSKRKKKLEEFVKTAQGILIVNYEIMTSSLKELVHEFKAEQVIADECFKGDVEVLTENGFIPFKNLKKGVKIAQYKQGVIDFILPLRHVKKKYNGEMVSFSSTNSGKIIECTQGHEIVYQDFKGVEKKIEAVSFQPNAYNKILHGAKPGKKTSLTPIERLAIATQADGCNQSLHRIHFSFSKKEKIKNFKQIMKDGCFDYTEIKSQPRKGNTLKRHRYSVVTDLTKDLRSHFDLTKICAGKAQAILEEMVKWDGSLSMGYMYFSNADEDAVNFYQEICVLAGRRSVKTVQHDNRKETYRSIHRLYISKRRDSTGKRLVKEVSRFRGNVYCVTVPKGNIIVRQGRTPVIIGNCHLVKSHKSKRSKEILKLRKDADSCFLLTGTPVLQTVTDLFMQFYIMDLGKTFGTNFYVFQRKYMIDRNAMWAGSQNYFPNWQVNEKIMPELENKIKESAIYMEKEKVLDLPPLIKKNYYVSLNPEQKRIYKDLSKKLIAEITEDKDLSVENALTKVLRLNQICAGHLSEDNIILKSFKDCEKNKLVLEIVDKVVESGEKIILWTVFKQDVVVLTELLSKYRNNLCYITGLQNTKQKAVNMSMFENDMEIKICIANMTAGGTGINLIAAKHSILFSRNYKLGDHLQSEARNHRKGSSIHNSIIQHNIIVRDSIEEEIVKALEEKKKIGKDLFSNPEKFNQFDKDFKSSLLKGFISGLY